MALVLTLALSPLARAEEPALLSFGVGYFDQAGSGAGTGLSAVGNPAIDTQLDIPSLGNLDISASDQRQMATDFRPKYRFDTSLLPLTEPWATIKPWAGVEVSPDGASYGVSGLLVDVPLGSFVLTPSAGIGLYDSGGVAGLRDTGPMLEFRTQLELGYEFDNESRLSLSYSHTASPGVNDDTDTNSSFIGLYFHLPSSSLFGQ